MKNISFFLFFLATSASAQVVVTCEHQNFVGAYAPENWTLFGESEIDLPDDLTLTGTIFEIQGGGDGGEEFPEEEIIASAEVMIAHEGQLYFDYFWSMFAPDCLERHVRVNDTWISPQVFETTGYAVSPGDILYMEIVWFPYEMDCVSGSWSLFIDQFRIVGDCDQFGIEAGPCTPTPDLDGDGWVGITDLMIFLGAFGSTVD